MLRTIVLANVAQRQRRVARFTYWLVESIQLKVKQPKGRQGHNKESDKAQYIR